MAAGALTEEVIEEVATNLEEVAAATRTLDSRAIGFFGLGLGVGLGVGFYFGRKWTRERLRADILLEAEAEIEQMREYYEQKVIAATPKPSVEEIIEEQGYSTAVAERPLPAPVPIIEAPSAVVARDAGIKDKNSGWSYPRELSERTPEAPYVIHQDEFNNSEHGYEQTSYTYFEGDDVLADDDGQPLVDSGGLVGTGNLKWGHGTDDFNTVYVRNDKLNLEMEITKDPRSWEETRGGLDGEEVEDSLSHSAQSRPAPKRPKRRMD